MHHHYIACKGPHQFLKLIDQRMNRLNGLPYCLWVDVILFGVNCMRETKGFGMGCDQWRLTIA